MKTLIENNDIFFLYAVALFAFIFLAYLIYKLYWNFKEIISKRKISKIGQIEVNVQSDDEAY